MLKHHAQLIAGNHGAYEILLKNLEAKLGLGKSHPDLMVFSYEAEKLGVDHADTIRNAVLRNPVSAPQIVVAIYAHTLTEQAQNALLKICEEPPANSFIFLVTDYLPHLIPTLRSRFVILDLDKNNAAAIDGINGNGTNGANGSGDSEKKLASKAKDNSADWSVVKDKDIDRDLSAKINKIATGASGKEAAKEKANDLMSVKTFLISTPDKRLAIAKDIHSALDKETLNIGQIWDFVNGIEKNIHAFLMNAASDDSFGRANANGSAKESAKEMENQEKMRDMLDVINRTQNYMHAPGNSVKMLLEYLAVRL